MRYNKPTILTTVSASVAIQEGEGNTKMGLPKANPIFADHVRTNPVRSTTGAYEADE
jgi:hypothetical protein